MYETALAYTEALRMADNAILFKFLAKSVGMKRGVVPSFMAKPWGNVSKQLRPSWLSLSVTYLSSLDAAGASACKRRRSRLIPILIRHIHVSLRDANGKSVFALSDADLKNGRTNAQYEDTKFISQEAEWFLAGVLDGLPDGASSSECQLRAPPLTTLCTPAHSDAHGASRPVLCQPPSRSTHPRLTHPPQLVPTINGYKRLVGGEAFWAPNAVTYGYDSRAASVRIISPPSVPPSATRMEIRVPGADMNPYFALSAIFALGLRGIEKKLPLPGPPVSQLTQEDRKAGKVRVHE